MIWLVAFVLTVVVEAMVVSACAPGAVRRRATVDSFGINLVTHPLAWWASTGLHCDWWVVEATVVVAETALYAGVTRLPPWRALLVAAAANGVTAAMSCLF